VKSAWVIGESHPDFIAAIKWLQSRVGCQFFADPSEALSRLRDPRFGDPLAFIFLQARCGQFDEAGVEQLFAAAPLAPLVCLSGPWCEGEGRSGRPLAGVTRVAWRNWQQQLPRELASLLTTHASQSLLPRTASDIQRIEASLGGVMQRGQSNAAAIVCTASRATFEAIGDLLGQLRMTAQWYRTCNSSPIPRGDLFICDGWEQLPPRDSRAPAPTLLLLHFPRPDDETRCRHDGIAAIVAQPVLLADWAAAISKAHATHVDGCGGA
jgi:hypothetical protein